MTNRFLWFTILVVGIFYFSLPKAKKVNKSFISVFKFNDKVESKLALIPTSPRWKYPFQNHNASIDVDGDYVFPTSTLPIISIKVKEKSLFSYKSGIYIRGIEEWTSKSNNLPWWSWPANYRKHGKKWERAANISFLGFGNKNIIQKAGIRINGNSTRAFPQKSLRLVFKKKYQKDGIENIFFENEKEENYRTLLLRNGGNDWDRAMLRDVLVARLSKNLAVETQDAKACNVYINGEYWGIHYLRPKIDDDFIANRYKIPKKNISILEAPLNIYRGDSLGLIEFLELLDFFEINDISNSINYSYVANVLDIESLIDYFIVQLFIVNADWPRNNWMIWKDITNTFNKGKWKWILKDTDYSFGFMDKNSFSIDMREKLNNMDGPLSLIFNKLLQNKDFESSFNKRKIYILNKSWDDTRFNNTLDSLELALEVEMPNQIDRWRTHLSVNNWKLEIESMRYFYNQRRNNFN